jgi:hypothetical protein
MTKQPRLSLEELRERRVGILSAVKTAEVDSGQLRKQLAVATFEDDETLITNIKRKLMQISDTCDSADETLKLIDADIKWYQRTEARRGFRKQSAERPALVEAFTTSVAEAEKSIDDARAAVEKTLEAREAIKTLDEKLVEFAQAGDGNLKSEYRALPQVGFGDSIRRGRQALAAVLARIPKPSRPMPTVSTEDYVALVAEASSQADERLADQQARFAEVR